MMTSTRLILGACIVLSALGATAGEVTPVACNAATALSRRALYSRGDTSSKPAEGSGTVHAKAIVMTFSTPGGKISVAVDSAKPDAAGPDTLRFDFTGKDRFTGAATVTLKPRQGQVPQGYYVATFGPETIRAALPGGTVPIMVEGQYYKIIQNAGPGGSGQPYRQMSLYIGMAVEGKGTFGKRVLPVRIIDGDGNLKAGDAWRTVGRSARPGDTLAIDFGDGSFTKDVRKACYGSPIEVDGAWYSVALGDKGKTLTVAPVDVELGKIHIKQPKWSCMLVGKTHIVRLSGGAEPVTVPVDSYMVTQYEQWGRVNAKGRRPHLTCTDFTTRGADKALVAVKAGKTAEVDIGSPLTASINATPRSNGVVSLALSLVDSSGRTVNNLSLPGGRRPTAPKVTVRDAAGKTVYSSSLEYG